MHLTAQYFVLFAVSYVSFSKAGKAHHVANSDYHFIFLILEGKATLIPNINVQIRWRWKYSLDLMSCESSKVVIYALLILLFRLVNLNMNDYSSLSLSSWAVSLKTVNLNIQYISLHSYLLMTHQINPNLYQWIYNHGHMYHGLHCIFISMFHLGCK